jgi:hypothetical protein
MADHRTHDPAELGVLVPQKERDHPVFLKDGPFVGPLQDLMVAADDGPASLPGVSQVYLVGRPCFEDVADVMDTLTELLPHRESKPMRHVLIEEKGYAAFSLSHDSKRSAACTCLCPTP